MDGHQRIKSEFMSRPDPDDNTHPEDENENDNNNDNDNENENENNYKTVAVLPTMIMRMISGNRQVFIIIIC